MFAQKPKTTIAPFPQAKSKRPVARIGLKQRLLHALAYLAAAVLGLALAPALLLVTDRATELRLANFLIDLVGGR